VAWGNVSRSIDVIMAALSAVHAARDVREEISCCVLKKIKIDIKRTPSFRLAPNVCYSIHPFAVANSACVTHLLAERF
jgi:hypothetical protein